jgi:hypothetical protein
MLRSKSKSSTFRSNSVHHGNEVNDLVLPLVVAVDSEFTVTLLRGPAIPAQAWRPCGGHYRLRPRH